MVVRQEIGAAVGGRGLEHLRRDLAAGAGAVLDDHGGAQLVLELLGQRARDRVGAAARRKADQQLDDGGLLRLRQAAEQEGAQRERGAQRAGQAL